MAAEPGRVFYIIQFIGSAHVCGSLGLMMTDELRVIQILKINQRKLRNKTVCHCGEAGERRIQTEHTGPSGQRKEKEGPINRAVGRGEADLRIMRTYLLIHILKEGALHFQINKTHFGPYLLSQRTGKLIH